MPPRKGPAFFGFFFFTLELEIGTGMTPLLQAFGLFDPRPALKLIKDNHCEDHQSVLRLFSSPNVQSMFPETAHLLSIVSVLPIGTATVERLFSLMKIIKTRLRKRLQDATLSDIIMLAMNAKFSEFYGFSLDDMKRFVDDWNTLGHLVHFASMDEYLQARDSINAMRGYLHDNRRVLINAMRAANAGLLQV